MLGGVRVREHGCVDLRMVARVDRALQENFGLSDGLADKCVVVLDPCCGTGALRRD